MPLDEDQKNEVRGKVVKRFGEDAVRQMDFYFMQLNDIRITSKDSYDFLERVKAAYPEDNSELLIAAILYGMRQGEIGYEYHLVKEAAKLDDAADGRSYQ